MQKPIKLMIVDDHQIFIDGITALLVNEKDIAVVATANNGKEAILVLENKEVDIVLTDIEMPMMNGYDATAIISKKYPSTKIIALTTHDEKSIVTKMLDAGAVGYLLKNIDKETLIYIFIFFLPVCSSFGQVHPVIKTIFYNLPLQKSRKQLSEVIVNDKRFISTDTVFNNYKTSSFFKGITANKGVIKSTPDSIRMMLVYGNTELAIAKGKPSTFKDVMILDCKYYFSNKDSAELEYDRLLNRLRPILKKSITIKNEAPYPKGTEKIIGEKFESFNPYYDVTLSTASIVPDNGSKSIFGLYIVFTKEDK